MGARAPRGWQATLATLYAGSMIGILYFVGDLPGIGRMLLGGNASPGFAGLITDPVQGLGIPFMLVGPLLAVGCVLIYVGVSLATPAMDQTAVAQVCWDHPLEFLKGKVTSVGDPRTVALILTMVVFVLYWLMR